jgi:hypothetical protein
MPRNDTHNCPHAISKNPSLNIYSSRQMKRARPSQWEGGQPDTPYLQVQSKHSTRSSPTYSIYCHAPPLRPLHFCPRRKHGTHTCTTSSGGGGVEANTLTHTKCSPPRYDTPVSNVCPSIILNKQTGHTVLADHALCLSGRNLACLLHNDQIHLDPY